MLALSRAKPISQARRVWNRGEHGQDDGDIDEEGGSSSRRQHRYHVRTIEEMGAKEGCLMCLRCMMIFCNTLLWVSDDLETFNVHNFLVGSWR